MHRRAALGPSNRTALEAPTPSCKVVPIRLGRAHWSLTAHRRAREDTPMKNLYALFSLVLATIPSSAQTGQAPFSIAISTQSGLVKAGAEILVEITLTNTSNHEIRVGKAPGDSPQAESEYSIEVRDSKGHLAPDTDYGRKVREKKIWFYRSRDSFNLQPGESRKDGTAITKLYDLSRQDRYTITVSRPIPEQWGKGTVKSNAINITVIN